MDLKEGEKMMNLREVSICISDGTVACWPQYGGKERPIDMSHIRTRCDGCYSVNNATICFVIDHEVFVAPVTRELVSTIVGAGLAKKYFYVPFSNGDYPKNEKNKWDQLCERAHESYRQDYEESCIEWCNVHGIGELSKETMKHCFKIPITGVPVKHPYYETTIYPACNENAGRMDCLATKRIGRYCSNNGKVAFVYCDGHTYVTEGYWIIDELEHAGYKRAGLFVPFSNGEEITDPYLAAQWERACSYKK